MKEINIPKAKKLIGQYRSSPLTGAFGKTDLQAAAAGEKNNLVRIAFLLLLFATMFDPTEPHVSIFCFLMVALSIFGFLVFRFRQIRDYLIANNVQNLDELER